MDEDEVERRVEARIAEVIAKQAVVLKKRYRDQALKAVEDAQAKGAEQSAATVSALQTEITTLTQKLETVTTANNSDTTLLTTASAPTQDTEKDNEKGKAKGKVEVDQEQLAAAYEKGPCLSSFFSASCS